MLLISANKVSRHSECFLSVSELSNDTKAALIAIFDSAIEI